MGTREVHLILSDTNNVDCYLLQELFPTYNPIKPRDYWASIQTILHTSYSKYVGPAKKTDHLNEIQYEGRLDAYRFLAPKMESAMEHIQFPHALQKARLKVLLWELILDPGANDPVKKLWDLYQSGEDGVLTFYLGKGDTMGEKVFIGVSYIELSEYMNEHPALAFTGCYYYSKDSETEHVQRYHTNHRTSSGYFLTLKQYWNDEIENKITKAYDYIFEMLNGLQSKYDSVRFAFYEKGNLGVSNINPIHKNAGNELSSFIITCDDLKNDLAKHKAAASAVFWMLLYSDSFMVGIAGPRYDSQGRLIGGTYFFFGDIFKAYSYKEIVEDSGYGKANLASLGGKYDPFPKIEENYNENFKHEDVPFIRGFHDYEVSNGKYKNIIDFFKDEYYLKLIQRKTGKDIPLFDLR